MTAEFDEVNIAEALQDPRAAFGSPRKVLAMTSLPLSDRVEILKTWKAQESAIAQLHDSEMPESLYDEVCIALETISEQQDG